MVIDSGAQHEAKIKAKHLAVSAFSGIQSPGGISQMGIWQGFVVGETSQSGAAYRNGSQGRDRPT